MHISTIRICNWVRYFLALPQKSWYDRLVEKQRRKTERFMRQHPEVPVVEVRLPKELRK